jgi:hypothetical protein
MVPCRFAFAYAVLGIFWFTALGRPTHLMENVSTPAFARTVSEA